MARSTATSSKAPRPDLEPLPRSSQRASSDIIGLIVDRESGLSKANRKIAHAILSDPQVFVEKPIEDIIEWLDVSAPTITRFARSLGCDGLRDLKLKIMGSMRVGIRYLEPPTPPAALGEVAERVVKRAQHAISNIQSSIDLAQVENVIKAIGECRTLYAFGSGGVSSWLIEEIQNRFFRLGIRVVPSSDHQMQMMLAATVEPGDVILCCSLTGSNEELIRSIGIAREYGATTIALAGARSAVAAAVDLPLAIDAVDDGDVLGPTSMRYAFLIAIDVLAYGTAIRQRNSAREKLRRIKQQFTTFRDSDDTQPMCD
jgi:DNA-binding MurR/RpiR family transcriptional regulator